jgi:hypothetical protein
MKKVIITIVVVLISCFSNQLVAQESITKQKTKSNNTNERTSAANQVDCVVRIKPTNNGVSIVFDNANVSPGDAANGLPTAKRMHKPVSFFVSPGDNTIVEVESSGDFVFGQANDTAKSTTSSGVVSKASGTPIGGIIVKGGKNPGGSQFNKIVITDGEFALPTDLADGTYDMSVSFTYQKIEMNNNEKNSKSYVSGRFILEIDGGACRSIRESGVSVKSTR